MLSFMLASLMAFSAHASVQDSTTAKSDAQCYVALNAALEAVDNVKDAEQAQQLSSAMFFYSGKLIARLPTAEAVWKLIEAEAQVFAEKDFGPTLDRCGAELNAFGASSGA